ncbi:MAG: DUF3179 domain-containing (seleno)protein [Pseudomonadota bacterium]
MWVEGLFWLGLIVSAAIGFLYFRDLGDVTQMILKVKRQNMVRFIRHESRLLALGGVALAIMVAAHLGFGAGPAWAFWPALVVIVVLLAFPWVWVHVGLRNQQKSARYYSVAEAAEFVNPHSRVIAIEKDGVARAHPDAQLMRPHLAGNDEGLAGENVVMTYCAMANLGIGYKPVVDGQACALEVLAQHGNNLILRDNRTGDPIQQIYGRTERTDGTGQAMEPWPTFRMTFRGFAKAYPNGRVFLNKPSSNVLLRLFDLVTETVFSAGIAKQHQEARPVMDNMTRHDPRLPNKTYVWGVDVGDDATCWTDDFVIEHDGPINANVGGRPVVVAWSQPFESLGVWWNDTGEPVTRIDFWGDSDRGKLARSEALKAGLFWHVWAEFFPQTDINRVSVPAETKTAARTGQPKTRRDTGVGDA